MLRVRDGVEDVSVAGGDRASVDNRECGNGLVVDHGKGWEAQYCHMAKGSLSVRPGDDVKAGDTLGLVGLSGMTEFPHLHFTLRHDGKVVDPFAFGAEASSCGGGRPLWEPSTAAALAYRAGSVLNKGFAEGPVTMAAVESAGMAVPTTRSPALVAYVRAIGLKGGDSQVLTLVDPDGKKLADNAPAPLDRDKAQWLLFSGVKAPPRRLPARVFTGPSTRSFVMENRRSSRHSPSSSNPDLTRGSARPPPPRRFRPRRRSATARSGSGTAS